MRKKLDWLTYIEHVTDNLKLYHGIEKVVYTGKTKYQYVEIFENSEYGRYLVLDGDLQSLQIDECIYHEALVHPSMILFKKSPQKVLVLGGGEGATIREVLRYKDLKKVVMVDIDGEVIELAKKYLPTWHQGSFDDKRLQLIIGDAKKYVKETNERFDVIISDLTEPLDEETPSFNIYTDDFMNDIKKILVEGGLFVIQSSNFAPKRGFFPKFYNLFLNYFRYVKPYKAFIPTFNTEWSYLVASEDNHLDLSLDELEVRISDRIEDVDKLKFYSPFVHLMMFHIPKYYKDFYNIK